MSKERKERARSQASGSEQHSIPERFQHPVAILLLLLSLLLFFNQIFFGGKAFLDVDNIASHSFDTLLADAKEAGTFPLWNPYIFCGMPAYGSLTVTGERLFDLTAQALGGVSTAFGWILLNPPSGWVYFFYFVFASGVYLLTYSRVKHKAAAFIAAFSALFSMYIIIWVMTGHNTKIAVVAFLPYILLVIEKLRERFSFPLTLVLILLLHFSFLPSHVQMIFYMYLTVGIYLLFLLLTSLFRKKSEGDQTHQSDAWRGVVRAGVLFAVATAIAFAMDSDRYLSVWEYNPYSIRGSNPIVASAAQGETKTVEGGLDYDYATSWSFAPGEMLTWIIPSWYGFGLQDYQGLLSNNQPTRINTYWGPQPFTHAPQYMGIIVLLLAIWGFISNRRDFFVRFLGVMIVVSLLIAFGKELPILYDLMYRYFPMFNKFRIPSMILVLVQIFVPVLAAYGIVSLIRLRENFEPAQLKSLKRILLGGVFGLSGILLLVNFSFEGLLPRVAIQNTFSTIFQYQLPKDRVVEEIMRQIPPQVTTELTKMLTGFVAADIYAAVLMLLITGGATYFYVQNKMKANTFFALLVVVIGFDLWRVASKPMEAQDRSMQARVFATPDHVQYLQTDSSRFRVLEFENGQPPYNNTLAYWRIQNAYGYQGAKMRSYQDMVDVIGLNNPLFWGLMNVKYIISNRPDSSAGIGMVYNGAEKKVYLNFSSLPRVFFVNRYEVADGLSILNKIATLSFNPRDVAYFMEEPALQIEPPHPAAKAEFVRHGIQDFEIQTTTSGNNLLFLSETYYPEGWKAFIDGKEVPIYRINYLFRGVVVPGGIHKLEMKFKPDGFSAGKNLSFAANLLVLGGLAYYGV
ncbi:MAG: YfhO family protein, partial [Bacteroidota bacterium]